MNFLTKDNYTKGFLIDDELMGGVSQDSKNSLFFIAFVVHPKTGEYLGYQSFPDLDSALHCINQVQRHWVYESFGSCTSCKGKKGCAKKCPSQGC